MASGIDDDNDYDNDDDDDDGDDDDDDDNDKSSPFNMQSVNDSCFLLAFLLLL